ncbi:MAG TPA: hypothetical protein VJS64_04430 [Pyrinomonadaceae bacterium]|nr:hypothetical protein [Pyrinomonadaceae bacterium]
MRIGKPLLIVLLFACPVIAQESDKPASGFERLARSCDDAASVIDSERIRLGATFEKELVRYLADDVEKHYQIACHITSCCTKRKDTSLELLSLMIKQQALSLLRDKKDDHNLYTTVALHISSAVQSEQLGFHSLAIAHKSEAEWLVSKRPILKGGFPAMEKEEWELYDSLPKQPFISKASVKRRRR